MTALEELEAHRLRTDATRNRGQLREAATRVFMAAGGRPSRRAIAREAGVGIATLCRHFPTCESLVDGLYRDQVAGLSAGAGDLGRATPQGGISIGYRPGCTPARLPHSGSVLDELRDRLTGYTMTEGSLHVPVDQPLPDRLVGSLVTVRLRQIRES